MDGCSTKLLKNVQALFIDGASIELIDNRLEGDFSYRLEGRNLYIFSAADQDWVWMKETVYLLNSTINHILVSSGSLKIRHNGLIGDVLQLTAILKGNVDVIEIPNLIKILSLHSASGSVINVEGVRTRFLSTKTNEGRINHKIVYDKSIE